MSTCSRLTVDNRALCLVHLWEAALDELAQVWEDVRDVVRQESPGGFQIPRPLLPSPHRPVEAVHGVDGLQHLSAVLVCDLGAYVVDYHHQPYLLGSG